MKSLRTVRYSLIAAAVAGAAFVPTMAVAGVSATAGVSNMYLWRGQNIGGGAPVVSGSLDYGHESGLLAGIWGSSAGPGQETDVYVGYAYSSDAFGFKVVAYEYFYPYATDLDLQEVLLNFSASGFFVDFLIGVGTIEGAPAATPPVASTEVDNENNYFDVGYTMDKVTVKFGMADNNAPDTNYSHLDATYAFNKNIAFTLSGIVDADPLAPIGATKDPLFAINYTLPIDLK